MMMKRSVFGTFVRDGVVQERNDIKNRRKGFRQAPKRNIKLNNPFDIYNHIFKYNKNYTRVPTRINNR